MNTIPELIEDVRLGKMVILIDDEDRENEGDIVLGAQFATPQAINFMALEARGLICLAMAHEQIDRLNLPLMVREDQNFSPNRTAFCVSIEASSGISTGISASDRAHTIRVAADPNVKASDVIVPGHVFPIRAKPGGVLKRAGHTEASVDLATLAGLSPAAVICEIMRPDGTMARVPDLLEFAKKHDIKVGTIVDLIHYRLRNETFVKEEAQAKLPVSFGEDFQLRIFSNTVDGAEHIVLQMGEIDPEVATLVRVHSECMTGDVFGSLRCDCGPQLHKALEMIRQEGRGILLYLRQEGRGIGLVNKIKAYALQDQGMDTVDANVHLGFPPDNRDYGVGAQILRAVGVRKLRLLTNNPSKRIGLKGYGLEVVERVPIEIAATVQNKSYLQVKKSRMGHLLDIDGAEL